MDELETRYDGGQETEPETLDDQEQEEEQERADNHAQQEEGPSRAEQAAVKAARLQAQRATEARLRQEFDQEIAGTGVLNPYTGKPFASMKEFREYGDRYRQEQLAQRAKAQGRPVEELEEEEKNRAYLSQKRKEEEGKKQVQTARQKKQAQLLADALDFQEKYPGVDIVKLEQDKKFQKFCGKRLYQEPIAALYEDYLELVSDAQQTASARLTGKQDRGTGGGSGGQSVTLTPKQQRELDEWNQNFPNMKMTAKEFMKR